MQNNTLTLDNLINSFLALRLVLNRQQTISAIAEVDTRQDLTPIPTQVMRMKRMYNRLEILGWKSELWQCATAGKEIFDGTVAGDFIREIRPTFWAFADFSVNFTPPQPDSDGFERLAMLGFVVCPIFLKRETLDEWPEGSGATCDENSYVYEWDFETDGEPKGYGIDYCLVLAPLDPKSGALTPFPFIRFTQPLLTTDTLNGFNSTFKAAYEFTKLELAAKQALRPNHNGRKMLKRASRHIPEIKVVILRRFHRERKAGQEPHSVNWQCQWVVNGHWRNQYYPSLGVHKPKYIQSYIKGPDELPLKPPKKTIHLVNR